MDVGGKGARKGRPGPGSVHGYPATAVRPFLPPSLGLGSAIRLCSTSGRWRGGGGGRMHHHKPRPYVQVCGAIARKFVPMQAGVHLISHALVQLVGLSLPHLQLGSSQRGGGGEGRRGEGVGGVERVKKSHTHKHTGRSHTNTQGTTQPHRGSHTSTHKHTEGACTRAAPLNKPLWTRGSPRAPVRWWRTLWSLGPPSGTAPRVAAPG